MMARLTRPRGRASSASSGLVTAAQVSPPVEGSVQSMGATGGLILYGPPRMS